MQGITIKQYSRKKTSENSERETCLILPKKNARKHV